MRTINKEGLVLIDSYKRADKRTFHRFEHSWVSPP